MQSHRCESVTGGVLAGGAGRRMGGADKGLLDLRGRPLAAHVLAALRPQTRRLLISANRNPARYADLGHPVIGDHLPGGLGPLAGVAALLRAMPDDWLLVAPCDTPLLPPDLADRLFAAARTDAAQVACPRAGGRLHAAVLLVHRDRAPALEHYLRDGGRRVQEWLAQTGCAAAEFDNPEAFFNINRPEDLAYAAARLSGRPEEC